jgi:hypothetical protein
MSHKHHMQQSSNQSPQGGQSEKTLPLLPARTPLPPRLIWQLVLVAVLGLLVGFGIGALVFRTALTPGSAEFTGALESADGAAEDGTDESSGSSESGRVISAAGVVPGGDIVLVKDQSAGRSVFLSRIELTAPGWAVVQEDTNGALGNVLGAKRFDAGVYQGTVMLLRPTEAGKTYHAIVWRDDGDKQFNLESDVPVSGTAMSFEAYGVSEQ